MYAIIGGSGLAKLTALQDQRRQVMRTPYGEPSGALTFGEFAGAQVVFLARHGYGHTLSPHEINYRANIWALKELKVEGVIAVATVGGIRDDLVPGTLVLPNQIIDYTHSRKSTFFEGSEMPVTHVDFTQPYARALRERLIAAAAACNEKVFDGAVYACTQGPRLETAAEIERIAREGGDVVGMTGMPEAVLAREAGLEYAAIAVVINHAAGRGDSVQAIKLEELGEVMDQSIMRAVRILTSFLRKHRDSAVIRPILRMGDPRLLDIAQPVHDLTAPELKTLVDDMFETMHAASGAGLAAPQIGVPLRVVIFGYSDPEARNPRYPDADPVPQTILINPVVEPVGSEMEEGWEGCLSVPGLRGVVPRYSRVRYTGTDLQGRPIDRVVDGFHARVVQHECDHLDGILYPMRVRDFSRFGYTDILFPEMADADN